MNATTAIPVAHVLGSPAQIERQSIDERAMQHARQLQLRLRIALFKVKTNQLSRPISELISN